MKTSNIRKSIESGLQNLYPSKLQGNSLRRFNHLVSMVTGLIDSGHSSLGKIAEKQEGLIQSLSRVKKNERWLDNKWVDAERLGVPHFYTLHYQAVTLSYFTTKRTGFHC